MTDSILLTIKKMLGMAPQEEEGFDIDLIIHINSAISILTQMGVGNQNGYSIENSGNTWDEFLADFSNLETIKTYIYLKVKKMFDPPQSGTHMESLNELIKELEWRISVTVDPGKK